MLRLVISSAGVSIYQLGDGILHRAYLPNLLISADWQDSEYTSQYLPDRHNNNHRGTIQEVKISDSLYISVDSFEGKNLIGFDQYFHESDWLE